MRFGWLFNWEELQTHWDRTSYLTFLGLHLKANRIFFSTNFRGLWIRIFVPAGLSQFPGTLSLFEFVKYIYCQAAFFCNSRWLIAKTFCSRQPLVQERRRSLKIGCAPPWVSPSPAGPTKNLKLHKIHYELAPCKLFGAVREGSGASGSVINIFPFFLSPRQPFTKTWAPWKRCLL